MFPSNYIMRRISIHALHEESDGGLLDVEGNKEEISIHALHEESDRFVEDDDVDCGISIHALHEESDWMQVWHQPLAPFQSTLSMRRATDTDRPQAHVHGISIHALHEESDDGYVVHAVAVPISIHALHEESDLVVSSISSQQKKFQSTLSMRRATRIPAPRTLQVFISIHALHEESDCSSIMVLRFLVYFNPRSP